VFELEKIRTPKVTEAGGVITIVMKPLSVNEAWQGRRFKTKKYKTYEKTLKRRLPKNIVVPRGAYLKVFFHFGFSNIQSDWDNPVKPLQDILQKKYKFNDFHIMLAGVLKDKVKEGEDFMKVVIRPFVDKDREDFLKNFLPLPNDKRSNE
jgi:hypothetical protein